MGAQGRSFWQISRSRLCVSKTVQLRDQDIQYNEVYIPPLFRALVRMGEGGLSSIGAISEPCLTDSVPRKSLISASVSGKASVFFDRICLVQRIFNTFLPLAALSC